LPLWGAAPPTGHSREGGNPASDFGHQASDFGSQSDQRPKPQDQRPTVYLVGAGPGDPGLITVRGQALLHSCDAVVYDALIASELVERLPPEIERHYVGKRSGLPSPSQNEINRLLIELARNGKRVVRLKGGDPLIFGRVGEEVDALREAGIPVEIVPGITTASAAAAAAGFSLTDRRSASFLVFATGHSAESDSPPVPWGQLAGLNGGALAIYMGLGALREIAEQLLQGGMPPDTPVVVAGKVCTPDQRFLTDTLSGIADSVAAEQLPSPALVLIGKGFVPS